MHTRIQTANAVAPLEVFCATNSTRDPRACYNWNNVIWLLSKVWQIKVEVNAVRPKAFLANDVTLSCASISVYISMVSCLRMADRALLARYHRYRSYGLAMLISGHESRCRSTFTLPQIRGTLIQPYRTLRIHQSISIYLCCQEILIMYATTKKVVRVL